jgi:hypothetical protein
MGYFSVLFSKGFWLAISLRRAGAALLGAFGALWLIASILNFFDAPAGRSLQNHWGLFLALGLFSALAVNWPRLRTSSQLQNRDVTIELRVGDMFKMPGAFVIGAATTFETRIIDGLISPRSVQGQFTGQFYDSDSHLEADIRTALNGVQPERYIWRDNRQIPVYPIGTVARVVTRGRRAYFLAYTTLNDNGVAQGTFEDIKNSLPRLWEFLSTRGDFERIVMPVLGTAFARMPEPRHVIIREIVKSFVAACSSLRPTEALTIVVPYSDYSANKVDLGELERYVEHVCKYTEFQTANATGAGVPLQ